MVNTKDDKGQKCNGGQRTGQTPMSPRQQHQHAGTCEQGRDKHNGYNRSHGLL